MRFLTLLLFIALVQLVQAATVQGTILDDEGIPIEDATVYNLTRKSHAHTDVLGRFELNQTESGDSLRIQAIGYATFIEVVEDVNNPLSLKLEYLSVKLLSVEVTPGTDITHDISALDLAIRPSTNSQELLRAVPGLFIGQHAGGGKAEQMFLRGFDIDHGTDIAISVDGMPVNMVSHAHGQGYADLHFLIPETVQSVSFTKGPYDASQGNFATAASVGFSTYDRLRKNLLRVEGGSFNQKRVVAMASIIDNAKQDAYIAIEALGADGPFVSPQNLQRYNALLKTNFALSNGAKLQLSGSHFFSNWGASGQVPQRAIDDGTIGRFGAIDDTEGGKTSRTNLNARYVQPLGNSGLISARAYVSHYDFELFSNFTFFLEDPINGDQIVQREDRWLGGGNVEFNQPISIGERVFEFKTGVDLRVDATTDSELSRTANRTETLERFKLGDIAEQSGSLYASAETDFSDFRALFGVRVNTTRFAYVDQLENGTSSDIIASGIDPKVELHYAPVDRFQAFLKLGSGYHANDARLLTGNTVRTMMPKAYGTDLGFVFQPVKQMVLTATGWYLRSQQEFVYVGDAGIVEPSGRSERYGVEVGTRINVGKAFHFGGDLGLTHARSIDDPAGENRIPLAPPLTLEAFAAYQPVTGFHASGRLRNLGNRPANEDYSITAEGYTILDLVAGYSWPTLSLDLVVDNALNSEWNETQFATESRLRNEVAPVEEIHFTPGAPRGFRARLSWNF